MVGSVDRWRAALPGGDGGASARMLLAVVGATHQVTASQRQCAHKNKENQCCLHAGSTYFNIKQVVAAFPNLKVPRKTPVPP